MTMAHIIRLAGNSLSERLAMDCRSQCEQFDIPAELVDAVDGADWSSVTRKLGIRIHPQVWSKKRTPGMYGCALSHYQQWQECVTRGEPRIVLEHDGYFIRPWQPDWIMNIQGVLKLDNLDPYNPEYDSQVRASESNTAELIEPTWSPKHRPAGRYSTGSYAYYITPSAAQNLLTWIKANGFLSSECQLADGVVPVQSVSSTVARLHPYFAVGNRIHDDSLTSRHAKN